MLRILILVVAISLSCFISYAAKPEVREVDGRDRLEEVTEDIDEYIVESVNPESQECTGADSDMTSEEDDGGSKEPLIKSISITIPDLSEESPGDTTQDTQSVDSDVSESNQEVKDKN
ncbi:MAG: hypothetical protein JW734_00660 [Candidatus Omnitrophica bacterium]|nr:hypothetical protein [Candidatus Omnitrophota bacterium]